MPRVIRFVYRCDNPKCNASVDIDVLTQEQQRKVKFENITCKRCGSTTRWREHASITTIKEPEQVADPDERIGGS